MALVGVPVRSLTAGAVRVAGEPSDALGAEGSGFELGCCCFGSRSLFLL